MGVSLRLRCLIFDRLLDWLTLLGRTSSSKDVELLVLCHGARPGVPGRNRTRTVSLWRT